MTYTLPAASVLSTEGIDLAATYTGYSQTSAVSSTNSPDYPGPTGPFALGQVTKGSDGSEWIYVLAGGTITQGDVLIITNTGTLWTANSITNALAASKLGDFLAVATLTAITSGQYGWVQRSGKCAGISVIASTAANTTLYTTTTAGRLSSASVASTTSIASGIVLSTANVSGTTQAILNFPVVGATQ